MASAALLTSLRTGAAVCAAAVALVLPGTTTTAAARPGAAHRQYDVTEAHAFLVRFYGHHGPTSAERLRDVTPQLRQRAARTTQFDLLLCAQNTPHDITVGRVTAVLPGRGRATVTTRFTGQRQPSTFAAFVNLDSRSPLRLSDITCPQ